MESFPSVMRTIPDWSCVTVTRLSFRKTERTAARPLVPFPSGLHLNLRKRHLISAPVVDRCIIEPTNTSGRIERGSKIL